MKYSAIRHHAFSAGHRVVGHENKCSNLHGHNYRIHFHCRAEQLDDVGRVIDFSVIKDRLCDWLEHEWDHKFLAWCDDPAMLDVFHVLPGRIQPENVSIFQNSIVWVPFNPTAENMAEYLVHTVGPQQLQGTNVELFKVVVEETLKCSATNEKDWDDD